MEGFKNYQAYSYNLLQLINRTNISEYLKKPMDELNEFLEQNNQFIFDVVCMKMINVSNNKKYSLNEFITLFNNDTINTYNNDVENERYIKKMKKLHYNTYKIYSYYNDFKIYGTILGLPLIYFFNYKVGLAFIFGCIYFSYDYFIKSNKISYKAEEFFGSSPAWLDNPTSYEWKKYLFILELIF